MVDTYTKILLTVIALALVALEIRPFFEPPSAIAQGKIEVEITGSEPSAMFCSDISVRCVSGCR